MRLTKNSIIALFAMLFVSCAKEESKEAQRSDVQLVIAAQFSDAVAQTKVTTTAFESGDLLGLYAVKSGGELNAASNLINNHQLKVAANGAITGDLLPAYYPDKSSSLDLFSYYPYQSGNATADALGVLVGIRTTQTDFSLLQASDLCYGTKLDAAPSAAPHPLQFRHSFAQLRLNFSLYEGCSAIATVKLLSIKDQAKLNLQTGVVTLLTSSVADVDPFVNNLLSYTAIVPAQSLSGACVEITLTDGTIYYYHAVTPIALKASATNTLNLNIYSRIGGDPADPSDPSAESDKGGVRLAGAPVITAWGAVSASGSLGESASNVITLYWLAPHASFAAVDKITVSLVDIFNRRREVDVTPTLDPLSSPEYATYTFPLILGADAGYPQIVESIKLYAGATLLRDSPRAAILGSVLSRAGAHTIGLNLWIEISETVWDNVVWQGASKTITVTTAGATGWTATSNNNGLTITKSGNTATLKWAENTAGALATTTRTATITIETSPKGATTTLTTTQNGVTPPANSVRIVGLWWSTMNVGSTTPQGYGGYCTWHQSFAICPSDWRLPTTAEFQALSSNVAVGTAWASCATGYWTTLSSVNGAWAGPGAKTANPATAIFFPAAGYLYNGTWLIVGTYGVYWASTESNSASAHSFTFNSSSIDPQGGSYKTNQLRVRCVQ